MAQHFIQFQHEQAHGSRSEAERFIHLVVGKLGEMVGNLGVFGRIKMCKNKQPKGGALHSEFKAEIRRGNVQISTIFS